jgi:sialate O-acetylesterase
MKSKKLIILFSLLASHTLIFAQLRLPKVIGNNMVLQRDKQVPIWGWAKPGEQVTVTFVTQQKRAKADTSGYWRILLSPLKASDKPADMTIAASNTITLSNILVGEVWLCSGQSNMEYTMKLGPSYAKPKKGIDSAALELTETHPNIRIFKVEKVLSSPDVTSTGWNECTGAALEQFSAVGFYFAKNIQRELNVPIGVISSSWGGSRIEPWTPAEAYKALPAFAPEAQKTPFMIDSVMPGKDYRSMILPLAPFALRGFLWYQGESNCMIEDGMRYADKMQALVDGWRKQWENDKLPFYSVQIAPYYYTKRKDRLPHTPQTEAEFWEAQVQSTKIPRTGSIAITDLVDNLSDIHPPYKWEVGRRLSLLALANDYNKKIVSSGPVYKSMKVKNGKVILSLNNSNGLKSIDGKPLSWFTIAGEDGSFVPANAEISGDNVVVSAEGIAKPKAVRFAWNEAAMPNLFNAAGLPAVPFRTDGLEWNYKK